MRRRNLCRRGFTLIEVLCALVLIGVVLPVAMQGVSVALRAASQARHVGEAGELARAKLAELTMNVDPSGYAASGDFPDRPGYRWESQAAEQTYGTWQVTVKVLWSATGGDRSVSLTTLVYPNALAASSSTSASSSSTSGGTN